MVEIYPAYLLVGKHLSLKVWFGQILESVDPKFAVFVFQYLFVFVPSCHDFTYVEKSVSLTVSLNFPFGLDNV